MKNLSSRFLPLLAMMLMLVFFAACEKDEIDDRSQTQIPTSTTTTVTSPVATRLATSGTQAQSSASSGGVEIECISIDFPFDFEIDGVVFTITSIAELDSVFTNNFTPTTMSADFVYPLNVTLEDGSAAVVADGNELAVLVSACVPGSGWGNGSFPAFFFDAAPCLSLSYPVMLEDMDGNSLTAMDETEFVNLLAANPNLTFVFPLNVVDSTGNVVSVADEQALFDRLALCSCPGTGGGTGGGHGGNTSELFLFTGGGCFGYNYPISIIDFDGNQISIADDNELSAAILNGNFANFVYSFDVFFGPAGIQRTITDEDDFQDILDECFGFPTYELDAFEFMSQSFVDSCYSLVYPFDVDVNGTTVTIADQTAASAFVNSNQHGGIMFPIDVVKGTQIITLTSAQDYDDLLSNCYGPGSGAVPASVFFVIALSDGTCYTLAYPITTSNIDGTTSVLNSEAEVGTYLSIGQDGIIQFPVDVVETATGATISLATEMDFFALLTGCQ